ncbi:hypothetical protein ACFLW5_02305 [Chloroflexota bacterium]
MSNRSWLIVLTGVFVIALVGLGIVYYQQTSQREELEQNIALEQSNLAKMNLENLTATQAEQEAQLSQVTSQFQSVKAILSQSTTSAVATDSLFDNAEKHSLEIIGVVSSIPIIENFEGIDASKIALTLKIEGDIDDIVSFVNELNNNFITGFIESVAITIAEPSTGEEDFAEIQLVIYNFRGG